MLVLSRKESQRIRLGDSIVVTENGAEYLTRYRREILLVDR